MSIRKFNITVNGLAYEVLVEETTGAAHSAQTQAAPVPTPAVTAAPAAPAAPAPQKSPAGAAGRIKISAPMQGVIVKINVKAGDEVKKGTMLCALEAMKMENEIFAPEDGRVVAVCIAKGAAVASGELLFTLD